MSSGGNGKSLTVVTWHHQTPQRRHLKRGRLGPPDVYPQEVTQNIFNKTFASDSGPPTVWVF